jgi:hypothetical protein
LLSVKAAQAVALSQSFLIGCVVITQEYYKNVLRMLQGLFKDVSSIRYASRTLQESLNDTLEMP